MEDNIGEIVVDGMKNDRSENLINLLHEHKISNDIIMLTLIGIGSHTEYYRVLYNRINNYKGEINDNTIKLLVREILHEIDRNFPEE